MKYLLLFTLLLLTKFGDTLKQDRWGQYLDVYNIVLTNTFLGESTLLEAIRQKDATPQKFGDLSYACTTYSEGDEISVIGVKTNNTNLIPTLVDQENDIMCFITVKNSLTEPSYMNRFGYKLRFLEPLKLHDSVYSLVEDNYKTNLKKEWHFIFSFRQESFNQLPFESSEIVSNHFKEVSTSLKEYDLRVFDNFFWTSPDTLEFFNRLKESNLMMDEETTDSERHNIWMKRMEQFKALTAEREGDFCNFNLISRMFKYSPPYLELHTRDFLDEIDQEVILPCLTYVVVRIALENSVHHVAYQPSPQPLNYNTKMIIQSGGIGTTYRASAYQYTGLRGDGQIISIADTGCDVYSCYFYDKTGRAQPAPLTNPTSDSSKRKVIQYLYNSCGNRVDTEAGHGTHTSGTAIGYPEGSNLYGDGMYSGMAPNAKLAFADLSVQGGLCVPSPNELYIPAYSIGARVQSNSWGNNYSGSQYYSNSATDNFIFTRKDFSIFFSAGNSGNSGPRTITREASCKNVIAVGSSQNTFQSKTANYMSSFSSRGPTYDNRIKPDITAPGEVLQSARAVGTEGVRSCSLVSMAGTSMASPAAAGSALLFRQYFMDNSNRFWTKMCNKSHRYCKPFLPTAYLIKALVTHGTHFMGYYENSREGTVRLGTPPDNYQGFGRLGMNNILPLDFPEASSTYNHFSLFVEDRLTLQRNSFHTFFVNIVDRNTPLRVTIAWFDAANVEGITTKALINDIDVRIVYADGNRVFPNNGSVKDNINTVEKIRVLNPPLGKHRIFVQAQALPTGNRQDYAIVITCGGQVSYS